VDKNFKNIIKEWNKFLIRESLPEKNESRIMLMIDRLQNEFSIPIYIQENHDGKDSVSFTYGAEYDFHMYKKNNWGGLFGEVECYSSAYFFNKNNNFWSNTQGIGSGEVNSCWYVKNTSDTTKGMGPLLYEVALEYISFNKKCALKPDHNVVTDEAKNVWEIYHQRDDVINIPLDVSNVTFSLKKYKDVKQITDDIIEDDTLQFSALKDKGMSNWHESVLSFAYKKNNTNIIDELSKRNLLIVL
jgi:hypothetical protein